MRVLIISICWLVLCSGSQATAGEVKPPATDLSNIKILDLHTARQVALAGNPDLAAVQARVEQARARVAQAAADWWPSIDLTGGVMRERLSDTDFQYNRTLAGLYNSEAERSTDNFSAGLQAIWTLFDGFYRKFNNEKAGYDVQSEQAAELNTRRLLATAVAEAFYNAQLARTNVDIAEADKAFYTRQLADAQQRWDVGAGTKGDILNIKVQYNSAETRSIQSRREFEAAGYGLAALMGLPQGDFPEHISLAPLDRKARAGSVSEDVDALINDAWAMRPDIRQREMILKQARAGMGIAQASFFPRVELAGAVNSNRQDDAAMTGDDMGYTVSMNIVWNLFDGGKKKSRLAEAGMARQEAGHALKNLKNQVASEVRQNLALLRAARDQVRLQQGTVSLVEENRDLAQRAYEAGEASLVRLNEAQRDLTTTYGRLAQAQASWHLARERLDSSVGRNL